MADGHRVAGDGAGPGLTGGGPRDSPLRSGDRWWRTAGLLPAARDRSPSLLASLRGLGSLLRQRRRGGARGPPAPPAPLAPAAAARELPPVPELPEVETIARRLAPALVGKAVVAAAVPRANVVRGSVAAFVRAVTGATIRAVGRRGKFLLIRLDGDRVWVVHLRMSGRFLLEPPPAEAAGGAGGAPDRYVRAEFALSDGARLRYVDPRTLGEMEVTSERAWAERAAGLGPEPLDPDFTPEILRSRLAGSRRMVKELLLDQGRIAGLGNIYACEALWRARVSPRRRGRNVGPTRAGRLHRAIVEVLTEAIGRSGTSLGETYLDWADDAGARGRFRASLAVYGREGEACPRCGRPIRRIVQGQRSTWYCPGCQR